MITVDRTSALIGPDVPVDVAFARVAWRVLEHGGYIRACWSNELWEGQYRQFIWLQHVSPEAAHLVLTFAVFSSHIGGSAAVRKDAMEAAKEVAGQLSDPLLALPYFTEHALMEASA